MDTVSKNTVGGKLHISTNVYTEIVKNTVDTCYGIVGISSPRGVTFFSYLFPGIFAYDGIFVSQGPNGLKIDIYVIVEYGTNIKVIAKNLCDQVRFQISKFSQVDIERINVHVKGIRKSGY